MKPLKPSIYLPIAFAVVLIAGMLLGSILNRNNPVHHIISPNNKSNYGKVDDIIDYIDYNYPLMYANSAEVSEDVKGRHTPFATSTSMRGVDTESVLSVYSKYDDDE